MRLHLALALVALLALSALSIRSDDTSGIVGVGERPCGQFFPQRHADQDVPHRMLKGLLQLTCSLDGALLRMEHSDDADPLEAEHDLGGRRAKGRRLHSGTSLSAIPGG